MAIILPATPLSSLTWRSSTFRSSTVAAEPAPLRRSRSSLGRRLGIARQAALDGGENFLAGARALHAAREGAQIGERFLAARRGERDFDQHVVLEDARARHVAGLRLAFAPGGEIHQNSEIARFPRAGLEALPGALGVLLVGRGRGEDLHFVLQPGKAAGFLELREQRAIDVAQVRDVADRVVDLRRGERAARPVGEARGLVDATRQIDCASSL